MEYELEIITESKNNLFLFKKVLSAETIDEIYYQAMADIDNAIDKSRDTSFSIKVLRYESREAFERLLDNLYPQK